MDGYGSNSCSAESVQVERDSLRNITPEHACPYLPDRMARHEAYFVPTLDGAVYERLLSQGFRRSGRVVYRPQCRDCHECRQVRVPVKDFLATKSMKRIWKLNVDVQVTHESPQLTDEKFELYSRYLVSQHDDSMDRSRESLQEFLYHSPTTTTEFCYVIDGRLAAVSILDQCPESLSSVYMFFDPDFARRSLGVFSVLYEIDYCRRHDLPYYYLGYYIADCGKMAYKARYRPNEILVGNGRWVSLRV